jgi:hypothetical protein
MAMKVPSELEQQQIAPQLLAKSYMTSLKKCIEP